MPCTNQFRGITDCFIVSVVLASAYSKPMSDVYPYQENEDKIQMPYNYKDSETFATEYKSHCRIAVNSTSALKMKLIYSQFKPNFGRIILKFNYYGNITSTEDVIRPFDWIWTFYDWNGLFSYIKWPYDFSLLSFGLLDAKTIPFSGRYLQLDVLDDTNCSLTIGEKDFDYAIGYALRDFTRDYLLKADNRVSFSYWCYLKTVSGVTNAEYQASLYLNYPTEFSDYYCCHTKQQVWDDKIELKVFWKPTVTRKMFELSFVPFIMSLIAFAYFPILLLSIVDRLAAQRPNRFYFYNMLKKEDQYSTTCVNHITDRDSADDIVYLDGDPPLSLTTFLGGLCGLVEKYPFAVSRLFRLLFIILSPCLLYIRILVYKYDKITNSTTIELLQHSSPMGYLSILAGFEESRKLFLPVLGGPIVVLVAFHVLGFLFIFIPRDLMEIIDVGCNREGFHARKSPIVYGVRELEIFSFVKISSFHGYRKAYRLCVAGVYMLFNPKFWFTYLTLQYRRCFYPLVFLTSHKVIAVVLSILLIPFVVVLAAFEVFVIWVLYGIPMVNFMYIVVRGFLTALLFQSVFSKRNRVKVIMVIMRNTLVKFLLTIFLSLCFVYFIFGFCTIFIDTFMFLSNILVYCFIAVIVYPSSSFGYLFFGIIFIYYVFKMFQKFGDGYFELLADAVEISCMLDADPYRSHVIEGTSVIEHTHGCNLDRLQINNTIVNCSRDHIQALRNVCHNEHKKIVYKNNIVDIPKSLFNQLVKIYRPVHIEIANIFFKLLLIIALIFITLRVIVIKPVTSEGISEMMHVVFIMAIGAIPKIIEVATDNLNHSVKKDILLRGMKSVILEFWREYIDCIDELST